MGIENKAVTVNNSSTYTSGNILKAEELTLDNTEQIKAINTNANVLNEVIKGLNDTESNSNKNSTNISTHWGNPTDTTNATNENLLNSFTDLKNTVNDYYSSNEDSKSNTKLDLRVTSLESASVTHTTDITMLKTRTATMYTMSIDSSSNGKTLIIKSVKNSE